MAKSRFPLLRVGFFAGIALLVFACNVSQASPPAASVAPLPSPTKTPILQPTQTLTATPTPANVQDLIDRCPTPEEIAAVDADLTLSFEYDPGAGTLVCKAADGSADLTLLRTRTYQALTAMRLLVFDQPLPWTDQTLYGWFISNIDTIRFRNDIPNSFCCEPAHAVNLVTSLFALDTDRWLQPGDWDENVQSLMVLLIHEARHSEGYYHTCGTRDQTLAEMGAFGVQYWTYVWLAYHSDPAFMTPGGPQPNLYREINRDMAIRFLETSAAGKGPFCQQAALTPGPSPTVPGG